MADGTKQLLRRAALEAIVNEACAGLDDVDEALILKEALRNIYDGIAEKDVATVLVMSARTLIEQEPNYSQVSARLLLDSLRQEVLSFLSAGPQPHIDQTGMTQLYADYFGDYILWRLYSSGGRT